LRLLNRGNKSAIKCNTNGATLSCLGLDICGDSCFGDSSAATLGWFDKNLCISFVFHKNFT
jgi:hypothetical protein